LLFGVSLLFASPSGFAYKRTNCPEINILPCCVQGSFCRPGDNRSHSVECRSACLCACYIRWLTLPLYVLWRFVDSM